MNGPPAALPGAAAGRPDPRAQEARRATEGPRVTVGPDHIRGSPFDFVPVTGPVLLPGRGDAFGRAAGGAPAVGRRRAAPAPLTAPSALPARIAPGAGADVPVIEGGLAGPRTIDARVRAEDVKEPLLAGLEEARLWIAMGPGFSLLPRLRMLSFTGPLANFPADCGDGERPSGVTLEERRGGEGVWDPKACVQKNGPKRLFQMQISFIPTMVTLVWGGRWGWGGDALEGGSPPPSGRLSLCPATVPLTASAGLNGICNRQ